MALDQFRSWATDQIQGGPPGLGPTGLFIASGTFDTPLISSVDGPILKPFGVVIAITVRFDLVYNVMLDKWSGTSVNIAKILNPFLNL